MGLKSLQYAFHTVCLTNPHNLKRNVCPLFFFWLPSLSTPSFLWGTLYLRSLGGRQGLFPLHRLQVPGACPLRIWAHSLGLAKQMNL